MVPLKDYFELLGNHCFIKEGGNNFSLFIDMDTLILSKSHFQKSRKVMFNATLH